MSIPNFEDLKSVKNSHPLSPTHGWVYCLVGGLGGLMAMGSGQNTKNLKNVD